MGICISITDRRKFESYWDKVSQFTLRPSVHPHRRRLQHRIDQFCGYKPGVLIDNSQPPTELRRYKSARSWGKESLTIRHFSYQVFFSDELLNSCCWGVLHIMVTYLNDQIQVPTFVKIECLKALGNITHRNELNKSAWIYHNGGPVLYRNLDLSGFFGGNLAAGITSDTF